MKTERRDAAIAADLGAGLYRYCQCGLRWSGGAASEVLHTRYQIGPDGAWTDIPCRAIERPVAR